MSRLSDILHTGRGALRVQQLAMQVIGQNTANVNTEGYSRRRLDLAVAPPYDIVGRWHGGAGVDIDHLGRVRDSLLDVQVRRANGNTGYWSLRDDMLARVEEVFNELGDNAISDELQDFWSAWQELANDPEGMAGRYSVLEKAQSLAAAIRRAQSGLVERRQLVDDQLQAGISDVNTLTAEVARLNIEIVRAEVGGEEASDLRDRRDLALDRLSRLMNITTNENSDGAVFVHNGGQLLVDSDSNVELFMTRTGDAWGASTTASYGISGAPLSVSSGELKALLDLRDSDIGEILGELDTFAVALASRINDVHRTGYGLNGSSGIEFFADGITGAADFRVSVLIQDDVSRVAAASAPDAPGDNTLALQIAGIQQEKLLNGGRSTLDEFYRDAALRVGSAKSYAESQLTTEQAAFDNLENRRQQVSGVSTDEEMTRLIQVQQAYDAAAKIINTVDEMMQTVLSLGSTSA